MQSAIVRLRSGATPGQAQAELDIIAKVLRQAHPDENRDRKCIAISLQDRITGNIRPALLMLFAATVVVLLVASANVANLLLSKTAMRRQGIAIRMTLRAASTRLVHQ